MATAINSQALNGDTAIAYGKRQNIAVPGADPADAALAVVNAAAAARETEREVSGASLPGKFAPDTADYAAKGSERG